MKVASASDNEPVEPALEAKEPSEEVPEAEEAELLASEPEPVHQFAPEISIEVDLIEPVTEVLKLSNDLTLEEVAIED